MFYDDFCKTDNQKTIYKAILELSKNGRYIAIQELDYLHISRKEIEDTLVYFEKNGLFKLAQRLGEKYPVIFSI